MRGTLEERLWARVEIGEPDDCWPWTGSTQSSGYGQIHMWPGKNGLTHRLAWEFTFGEIPEGMTVDHKCFRKICCNPSHMELVTREENARRMPPGWVGGQHHLAKTHCPQGHPYSEENTYRPPSRPNERFCRTCARERYQASRA